MHPEDKGRAPGHRGNWWQGQLKGVASPSPALSVLQGPAKRQGKPGFHKGKKNTSIPKDAVPTAAQSPCYQAQAGMYFSTGAIPLKPIRAGTKRDGFPITG